MRFKIIFEELNSIIFFAILNLLIFNLQKHEKDFSHLNNLFSCFAGS